jgi:hypothetical protein
VITDATSVAKQQYSIDGGASWQTFNNGNEISVTAQEGGEILFRGTNRKSLYAALQIGGNPANAWTIEPDPADGKAKAGGDIGTLLDYRNIPSDLGDGAFSNMFEGCTSLVSAPELTATTLAEGCYAYMFSGCTSLVSAPALPAEALAIACYTWMFAGCTSLVSAPALPAEALEEYCYLAMFGACTSLATAPALPAKTLAESCYLSMFNGCESLATAPALPAKALEEDCYSWMFSGCTNLDSAPALPAETLATRCYQGMFRDCESLVDAPALPAQTLKDECYQNMFEGCIGLKSITVSFTSWDPNYTNDWVKDVPSGGTFTCPTGLFEEYGDDRIPQGWTYNPITTP